MNSREEGKTKIVSVPLPVWERTEVTSLPSGRKEQTSLGIRPHHTMSAQAEILSKNSLCWMWDTRSETGQRENPGLAGWDTA